MSLGRTHCRCRFYLVFPCVIGYFERRIHVTFFMYTFILRLQNKYRSLSLFYNYKLRTILANTPLLFYNRTWTYTLRHIPYVTYTAEITFGCGPKAQSLVSYEWGHNSYDVIRRNRLVYKPQLYQEPLPIFLNTFQTLNPRPIVLRSSGWLRARYKSPYNISETVICGANVYYTK